MHKVVILAGGYGTRFSEETQIIPKPMIEIGDKPILWHLMKYYNSYKYKNFILCLGYKQEYIREYFKNYFYNNSNITINTFFNSYESHSSPKENWNVSLIDTGLNTLTGGRLLRLKEFLKKEKTFMLTYGDGLSTINLDKLLGFHQSHGKIATVSIVPSRDKFGVVEIDDNNMVRSFNEKKVYDRNYRNIGFFVLNSEIFNYLEDDNTILERKPLELLVKEKQLMAYEHDGFFKCMDSLKDKKEFEQLVKENNTPWKIWE